jgi:hypothetical protein
VVSGIDRGGGGGSKFMRRCHDSGGPTLGNHQLGHPPPPAKGRMSGGGSIWALHRRSERIDLDRPDLCTPLTQCAWA